MDNNNKDEEFENVTHEEADTSSTSTRASDDLSLTRVDKNEPDQPGEDEDSDEDEHAMSHHPLFGMLAGRLGQQRRRGSSHKYDKLHPENQVLTVANIEDCVNVENSAFPPQERCSKEKFEYRLTVCPELSLGIFSQPTKAEVQKGSKQKRRLIAHIIATRTAAPAVTDESMDFPKDWQANRSTLRNTEGEPLGHQEQGKTICIHSVAVAKEYQDLGIGSVLLKSYIQRMKDAKIADKLAIIVHDNMKKFYGRFGFDDMGPSQCSFAGGKWSNMILDFSDLSDD